MNPKSLVLEQVNNILPVRDIQKYGAYGDIKLLAAYCDADYQNVSLKGEWQHGWIPPERNIHPEFVIGSGGESRLHRRSRKFLVARQDQVEFLRHCGYTDVQAIAHPIIYLNQPRVERLPNSLLIMPAHSTRESAGGRDKAILNYLEYLETLLPHFDHVLACVHPCDLEYYKPHFYHMGIDVVEGSAEEDQNSYERMAILGLMFAYMTTNTIGSHVAYFSYFGSRVSVSGPKPLIELDDLCNLTFFKNCPDCLELALNLHDRLISSYPFLAIDPWLAEPNMSWARDQLGDSYKLPIDIARQVLDLGQASHEIIPVIGSTKKIARKLLPKGIRRQIRALSDKLLKSAEPENKLLRLAFETPSPLTKDELRMLMVLASTLPDGSNCVEIGSYLGASALATCAGFNSLNIRLYCVDTCMNGAMAYTENGLSDPTLQTQDILTHLTQNTLDCKKHLILKRCLSHDAFPSIASEAGHLNWLFIDGDHSHNDVKRDWALYSQILAEDALIIFHDAGWSESVVRLITEEVVDCCVIEASLPNMQAFRYIGRVSWL